jgi:membrane protein YqaA with SNARE-associated domain
MAYLTLFLTAWLAATIFPFSSEVALTAVLAAGYDVTAALIWASLGNCAGATTNYVMGLGGATWFARRFHKFDESRMQKYQARFQKAEKLFMFCSWLPVIGDPITLYLGIAKVPFRRFALWVYIPRIVRYIVIAIGTTSAMRGAQ